MMDKSYNAIKLLGTLIVERGWVSQEEVKIALEQQPAGIFFGKILLNKQLITESQLQELLKLQVESEARIQDFLFGQIAVHNKMISAQNVIMGLEEQKAIQSIKSLGEILKEKGLLTQQQCNAILASQDRIRNNLQRKSKNYSCPKCQSIYKIKDPERHRKIRCKNCLYIFEVGPTAVNVSKETKHFDKKLDEPIAREESKSLAQFLLENELTPQTKLSDSTNFISNDKERYVLGDELARGGMGKIILTKDINLRRSIVTKVLLNKKSKLATLRFIEEAQITGQLEHPNIPPVYDLGINNENQLFFTMKQIKGHTLQHIINLLKNGDPQAIEQYSFNSLTNIFIKVCNALDFAHSKKVIHRDIKPENIMVGEYGEVLLMDWGLAKIIGTTEEYEEIEEEKVSSIRSEDQSKNTLEGTTAGTPAFMSPEQATAKFEELNQKADIYSLGATLFNALALERPINGKNAQEILEKAAVGKIQELDDEIPVELRAITLKAMAFDQKDRYQSIKEMEKDLVNYQMGYSVSAKQDNTLEIIKKIYKRNKVLSIVSMAFVFVLIVSSILFITSLNSQKNTAIQQKEIAKVALHKAEVAIKQFEKEKAERIADNKGSAPSFYAKAQMEAQMYNSIEAEKLMDTAISYDPENQNYKLYRGCLAFTNNNIQKSIFDLKLIKNNPHQSSILKILEIINRPDLMELDERQKALLAEQCNDLKFFDIAQKLTSEFNKKIEIWNKKLDDLWGKNNFTLAIQKDLNKGKDEADKLTFSVMNQSKNIDYTPLKGIPIQAIKFNNCQVSNINFMENMPIEDLTFIDCPLLADLSSLKNIKLKSIHLENTKVKDLTPLSNSELVILSLKNTPITTLKPLQKIPILGIELHDILLVDFNELKTFPVEKLYLNNCKIFDLDFINTKDLKILALNNCRIRDLSKLVDAPLLRLEFANSMVSDISPFQNKDLKYLNLEGCYIENFEVLLTLKNLDTLIITPNHLLAGWEKIIFQIKDIVRRIGLNKKQTMTVPQFLDLYKSIHQKNPIK